MREEGGLFYRSRVKEPHGWLITMNETRTLEIDGSSMQIDRHFIGTGEDQTHVSRNIMLMQRLMRWQGTPNIPSTPQPRSFRSSRHSRFYRELRKCLILGSRAWDMV